MKKIIILILLLSVRITADTTKTIILTVSINPYKTDFNSDGVTDTLDLKLFMVRYNTKYSRGSKYDLNKIKKSGYYTVDIDDLKIFLKYMELK